MKLAFAWVGLASLAIAQPRCALEGQIVDQATRQPLAGTRLFATGQGPAAIGARTDQRGFFCFPRLDPGSYHLTARRTGYRDAEYLGMWATIEVRPEIRVAPLSIGMMPRLILSGTVVDSDGEPVSHAHVLASTDGTPTAPGAGSVYTDRHGAFRFYDLEPGTYYLTAWPPMSFLDWPNREAISSPKEHMVETDYGSAIRMDAGQELTGVRITMHNVLLRRLSGRVVGVSGAKSLVVETPLPSGGTEMRNVEVRPDGTFESDRLLPGKCIIHLAGADKVVDLTNGDADGVVVGEGK